MTAIARPWWSYPHPLGTRCVADFEAYNGPQLDVELVYADHEACSVPGWVRADAPESCVADGSMENVRPICTTAHIPTADEAADPGWTAHAGLSGVETGTSATRPRQARGTPRVQSTSDLIQRYIDRSDRA